MSTLPPEVVASIFGAPIAREFPIAMVGLGTITLSDGGRSYSVAFEAGDLTWTSDGPSIDVRLPQPGDVWEGDLPHGMGVASKALFTAPTLDAPPPSRAGCPGAEVSPDGLRTEPHPKYTNAWNVYDGSTLLGWYSYADYCEPSYLAHHPTAGERPADSARQARAWLRDPT